MGNKIDVGLDQGGRSRRAEVCHQIVHDRSRILGEHAEGAEVHPCLNRFGRVQLRLRGCDGGFKAILKRNDGCSVRLSFAQSSKLAEILRPPRDFEIQRKVFTQQDAFVSAAHLKEGRALQVLKRSSLCRSTARISGRMHTIILPFIEDHITRQVSPSQVGGEKRPPACAHLQVANLDRHWQGPGGATRLRG